MDQSSKSKQVLSDIEQSVQNALALFNSEDFGILSEPLKTLDDPIVHLHDMKTQELLKQEDNTILKKDNTIINTNNAIPAEPTFFQKMIPKLNFGNLFTAGYTNPLIENNKTFPYGSTDLPFSADPVKSSVEQMSKLLNDKSVLFEQNEPSPEDILNIYSEDLGINLSGTTSPRKDFNYQHNDNEQHGSNQVKRDKKQTKTIKQPTFFTDKRNNGKKKDDYSKSTVLLDRENRMKDLMNIYGGSNTIFKPHSDSTLGSKSEINKKTRTKKIKKSDDSSKSSSVAPSRKSKRKSKRSIIKSNIDIFEGDVSNLEKSSRVSTKRKLKQKSISGNMKSKNQHPKRKRGSYLSNDNTTSSILNKNPLTIHGGESVNKDKHHQAQTKCSNKILNLQSSVKSNKHQYKKSSHTNKVSSTTENKHQTQKLPTDEIGLHRKQSHELQINTGKQVLFNEDIEKPGDSIIGSFEQNNQMFTNGDMFHEDFNAQQTLHYTLPTHSSRSKEVERFLNGHYQHLPFVIGQSTNKSHNLWVNIQEALSLIKQKVPQANDVQSVSHYNNVESENTPSIFSKISKASSKKPHQCPAAKADSLYDIPEGMNESEDNSDVVNSWENHPACMKANIDPDHSKSRCSCLNQPSVGYKKVLRQIFGGLSEGSDIDSNHRRDFYPQEHGGDSYIAELRKALISFTQEFEQMNNKFDEMSSDPNASKDELQRLEMQLVNKEEEIRELIARFNEVKELNERSREGSKSRVGCYSLESFKSTTSIRLAQTLRRVQKFKESLKSKPSVPFMSKNMYLQSSY